jgi:D-3-phosphoglycerate dehydrogenase
MPFVLRWGRSAYETDDDLALERAGIEALGLEWRNDTGKAPPEDLARADVLVVTSGVRVDAAVLDRLGGDVVITTTSGYDHVDVDALASRGMTLLRCPEARRDAVAEQALGSLILLMRGLPELERVGRKGRWARGELPMLGPRVLAGSRVAVFGLGIIGSKVARLLSAFDAEVLAVDPAGVPGGFAAVPVEEALSADAITLHCSLTPSSRGLLSADRLDRLAPHAVVVNTARGDVLDLERAVAAVRAGRLRGLAVDVFPVEPYPELAAVADLPNVLFTPHSSGYAVGLGARVAREVVTALTAWQAGSPLPHRVT